MRSARRSLPSCPPFWNRQRGNPPHERDPDDLLDFDPLPVGSAKIVQKQTILFWESPADRIPPLSLSEDKIAHDHCYQLKRIRIICKSFGEQNIYLSLSKYHILRSFPEFAIISIELKLTTVNA